MGSAVMFKLPFNVLLFLAGYVGLLLGMVLSVRGARRGFKHPMGDWYGNGWYGNGWFVGHMLLGAYGMLVYAWWLSGAPLW
jgi:hypothetical protein